MDVEIIDEDNIDAGDSRVALDPEWEPLLKGIYELPNSRYVCIAATDNTPGAQPA